MGKLETELQKISRTLNSLAIRLDQAVAQAGASRREGAKGRRTVSKKHKAGESAPDVIMAIIRARKKGIDTATLRAKTGFGSQKVRSIVWQLSKKRKIERIDRGFYKAVK
jgi:two-component sensor histidine kinase